MKTSKWIVSIIGATVMTVGGASATWATGSPSADRVSERCIKVPVAKEHIDERQAAVEERLADLTARRTTAEQAGETRKVERIDRIVHRLELRADRLTERETRVDTWAARHCAGA